MPLTILPETPPLRVDKSGAIRVGKTRVLFVLVVRAFQDGESPEGIIDMFDTLTLDEVYGACAYYLRHKTEVEAYLEEYDRQAEAVWRKIEERQGNQSRLRQRLLAEKARRSAAEVKFADLTVSKPQKSDGE